MKPIVAVPATLALVYRAYSRKSLTPLGIVVAAATAVTHAIHPWSVFFALLCVFFLAGTAVTKVKHNVKAQLTHSSSGSPGGEGARNHVQVFANSGTASILILLHTWALYHNPTGQTDEQCWTRGASPRAADVLVAGIVANYAAVAADTFSSELGILSKSSPRYILTPWRNVPPGTNGGVTGAGLLAGLLGSFIISLTATALMPFCSSTPSMLEKWTSGAGYEDPRWDISQKIYFMASMTLLGMCGSILDSVMGALLQASVVDVRTGKVIEGDGGRKVPVRGGSLRMTQGAKIQSKVSSAQSSAVKEQDARSRASSKREEDSAPHQESRRVETGWNILDNNGVNFAMAASISLLAISGACVLWDIPISSVAASYYS
ncbi:hypothetical protein K402DRAFT_397108 [Aulographum hederae CBS 113979]|uniref:DUF92 domain protein n=1 Tax=Aulographum hederae CBS 113979 TaxID=1176131 RepID=A0A6G1GQ94_9PEZI|nr:hypothetical protein K402DRAFT_397108 [Aulographum hederae CBS 113979]